MAFGFKIKKFTTSREYTIEELYEAIKDKTFTAGKPELTKHGLVYIITFPPLDRNNQIWVFEGQIKKPPYSKWTVQKNEAAGVANQLGNEALSRLTGGLSGISSIFGKKAKEIEKLVETTAAELEALGL